MTLRRAQGLRVAEGAIGHYVHGSVADGLGRIGVIVALEVDRRSGQAQRARTAGRYACRSRKPCRARRRRRRSGDGCARARGAGREERRQARKRDREDRRIGPQDLLQGGLLSSIRPMSTIRPRPSRRRSRKPKRRSARRSPSPASSATRWAKASTGRRKRPEGLTI